MTYEVVVVGAGLGGLTTAALLAARGVRVCVLEREAQSGGCAAPHTRAGYEFESGAGLYAGWQPDGLHARIFAELPVAPPAPRRLAPAYVVRLPDGAQVRVGGVAVTEFEADLRAAFPECAAAAVEFYRALAPIAAALRRSARRYPALATAPQGQRLRLLAAEPRLAARWRSLQAQTVAPHLAHTSPRFRRFVDAQLQLSAQCASAECAYLYAALALTEPQHGLYELQGGAAALTAALAAAVKQSGGTVRLNAPVLRLAYDTAGRAVGVDLLSGETVTATRAIVSNLTVWDTYGKLVGPQRTPAAVRARLRDLQGRGAYLLFAGLNTAAAARLPAARMLVVTDEPSGQADAAGAAEFMFSAAPAWVARAPAGQFAVTVSTRTDAAQWFAYHEDEREHEAQDQAALENLWARLHAALPELGAGIEVVDTLTPRGYYEQTRRRLGMVGGGAQTPALYGSAGATHRTTLPNLYLVGDTVFPGASVAAVTHGALVVADELAARRR